MHSGFVESQRDVEFRSKLSDAPLADGNGQGILSDHSDVESIHSAVSERELTPRLENQTSQLNNDKVKVKIMFDVDNKGLNHLCIFMISASAEEPLAVVAVKLSVSRLQRLIK